jgi:hypothetical protein
VSLVDRLAKIGPRPAGSEASARAAGEIAETLSNIGLEPWPQEFDLLGYEPGLPRLDIDAEPWVAAPCMYSHPTPAGGVEGTLRHLGTMVVLRDLFEPAVFSIESAGREVARLYGNPLGGGAVPFSSGYGPTTSGPAAYVSTADAFRLREREGAHVRLETTGRFVPGMRERNVLALIPGESEETVIVSAHFDSAWRSPGAIDNASGVEALRRIAEALHGRRLERSVLFAAFGAEELGLLGSRFFVQEARLRGDLGRITAVVNLDCVARGERLEIKASPASLRERAYAHAVTLGLEDRYPVVAKPSGPGTDDHPFWLEQVPALALVFWTYPEYHLHTDLPALVDEAKLADVTALALALVEDLAAEGCPAAGGP